MRKIGVLVLIGILLVMNGFLLWQTHSLRKVLNTVVGDEARISMLNGIPTDMRGVYTMPTIGEHFMPEDSFRKNAPALTMAVFVSTKTNCSMCLSEFEVLKRLIPAFESKGQRIVAVCAPEDSLEMVEYLKSISFEVPLATIISEECNFSQMGISPKFMPFKVLFDSTYTAIYMRGANNTPESQLEFEAAMLRLSEFVANGVFAGVTKPKAVYE